MPDDVREFARQAREFLDAHATRAEQAEFRWGQGEDTVAYFKADPPDVRDIKLQAAKDWQRTRYENGFGWISGPPEYGGRGLTPVHELVLQLRGTAGARQVPGSPAVGYAHLYGAPGVSAVTILST